MIEWVLSASTESMSLCLQILVSDKELQCEHIATISVSLITLLVLNYENSFYLISVGSLFIIFSVYVNNL